jgi:fibronectin type 3 domain-containing protein
VDTFPPAPPKGLSAVSTAGAINLIWEANAEADLAGYHVLRAQLPDTRLIRVTSTPIQDASFLDNVQPGARFVYAVTAVDKAGNISEPSNRVEETAR